MTNIILVCQGMGQPSTPAGGGVQERHEKLMEDAGRQLLLRRRVILERRTCIMDFLKGATWPQTCC
jgi:hypothetical protein